MRRCHAALRLRWTRTVLPNLLLMGIAVITAAPVLPHLLDFLETKLVYKDDGYGVARRKVVDAEKRLGATWSEAQETLFLREMLARVRREASDATRSNPSLWVQHIESAKQVAAMEISHCKPHLVHRFQASVGDLTYRDILYPAEVSIVDRSTMVPMRAARPTEDQWAAVRIVRN